ncbi:MAG: hypothetical protein IT564_11355 [Rhodospirillales bacterium]|nr:hypothetical protein [Rhodospirillales bacterium]
MATNELTLIKGQRHWLLYLPESHQPQVAHERCCHVVAHSVEVLSVPEQALKYAVPLVRYGDVSYVEFFNDENEIAIFDASVYLADHLGVPLVIA